VGGWEWLKLITLAANSFSNERYSLTLMWIICFTAKLFENYTYTVVEIQGYLGFLNLNN
jgi:hypothetical protein